MLPGFHPAKHLLLLFARHSVEMLQPLFKLALPAWRQAAKRWITLQCPSLLI
jgi:hypothetical protein